MERYADLHVHTVYSDGSYTPEAAVQRAKDLGFAALGLSDHDTVRGFPDAVEAGVRHGIEIVPAIELSTRTVRGQQHILGYYVDGNNAELVAALLQLREAREARMKLMVAKLGELGIAVPVDELWARADGGAIGRPHLARFLHDRGVVGSIHEAFERLIGRDGPAFVPKAVLTAEQAIALIRRAGGVPVIAHPVYLGDPGDLDRLIDLGIGGIEVYYPDHTPADTERFLAVARRANLCVTGGSDCHGAAKDRIYLGTVKLPYEHVVRLRQAAGR